MSKDIYKVYKITNSVNNKPYIGLSEVSLINRWTKHKSSARTGSNTILHKAMRKYGIDKFDIEHVATAFTKSDMEYIERLLIDQYDCLCPNGYNLTTGGESGYDISEVTRERMRQGQLGKKHTKERVERARNSRLKNWDKTCSKISKSLTGKKQTPETIAKKVKSQSKEWIVIKPDGQHIQVFNLEKFCRDNNLNSCTMNLVASGIRTHHKGYKCIRK
jgi:group I intron endonuclease